MSESPLQWPGTETPVESGQLAVGMQVPDTPFASQESPLPSENVQHWMSVEPGQCPASE